MCQREGFPIVVSGPSGAGKTTLCQKILADFPGVCYSISVTTRPPRPGEEDGVAYRFVSREQFDTWISEGRFCEWAHVHGHFYGTLCSVLEKALKDGWDVIMDLDVQGGASMRRCYSHGVFIFVLPPSPNELRKRLVGRKTDSTEVIEHRLTAALEEVRHVFQYDYLVINDAVDRTVEEIASIISAERCRRQRQVLSPEWCQWAKDNGVPWPSC